MNAQEDDSAVIYNFAGLISHMTPHRGAIPMRRYALQDGIIRANRAHDTGTMGLSAEADMTCNLARVIGGRGNAVTFPAAINPLEHCFSSG